MSSTELFYENIQPLKLRKSIIKKYVNRLILNELLIPGNLNIIFCTDVHLLEMNKQYLDHDYYTDILTFNYVEDNKISGDLFISYDRIKENAENYQTKIKWEIMRVIFHGVLHLVGYDDKTEAEKEIMRQKEDFYLKEVDFKEIKL